LPRGQWRKNRGSPVFRWRLDKRPSRATLPAMPDITPPNLDDAGLDVATSFVRSRNALLARAEFGDLFVDYYLHLSKHQMHPGPTADAIFKRALAAFVLHCASRPRTELVAWTINFQQ